MTQQEMQAQIEKLTAENERLKTKRTPNLTIKVSAKGAVSVYGLGRFPLTLYREQMLRLLGAGDDIKAFIEANSDQLKVKGEEAKAVAA